jgi:hypothetical protein
MHNRLADSLATLASIVQTLHQSTESFVVERMDAPATDTIWRDQENSISRVPELTNSNASLKEEPY